MTKIYLVTAIQGDEMRLLESKQEEILLSGRELFNSQDEEEGEEREYQVINGIALYDISGKMLNKGNFFTRMFGIPSYEDISNTIGMMAEDPEVDQVLIGMSTPGGPVGGISDISDSWKKLNAIKPITVHTSSSLGSAGVWLASNSSKIYASEVAEVGSIGAVMVHVSQENALKREGLEVTILRSSPLKAIGGPAENLTPETKAHLQTKINESDELFRKQLYTNRPGISPNAFTGEMFSAADALQLGLIDGVETYSNVFSKLSATAADSNHKTFHQGDFDMKRKVTAAMAEAAIDAGADPKTLEVVTQAEYDALQPDTNLDADGNPIVELDADGNPIVELDADGNPIVKADADADPRIAALTGSLIEANAENEDLTAKVTELEAKLEATASDPLRLIAEERIGVMRVALGLTTISMADFPVASLLTEYTALTAQFKKSFPSGGLAPKKNTKTPSPAKVTSIESARFKAVGIN